MAVTVTARMTEDAYRALALTDAGKLVELWDGEPREKPAMSWEHGDVATTLVLLLGGQLDRKQYRLRSNHGRIRHAGGSYYIPDVAVIPTDFGRDLRGHPDRLEFYDAPLPLVVEIWSPSTGAYDVAVKLARYQERGDEEIWYLHPYERTLTAWRRQADGTYRETLHREGVVRPASLPAVAINLGDLYRRLRATPPGGWLGRRRRSCRRLVRHAASRPVTPIGRSRPRASSPPARSAP